MKVNMEQREQMKQRNKALKMQNGGGRGTKGANEAKQ
jgi:hypothetical protein